MAAVFVTIILCCFFGGIAVWFIASLKIPYDRELEDEEQMKILAELGRKPNHENGGEQENRVQRYYFTFGSDEKFPYQNTYLVVEAVNWADAANAFRSKYPDVHAGCLNCSDYYDENQWNNYVGKVYAKQDPAEIIQTKGSKEE